jgi:hypothetical protein
MRKKSKYKPKGVRIDALNWVLDGLKPFSTTSHNAVTRIRNHDAMDTLRRGDATRADIEVLIGAFNMTVAFTMLRPELGVDWQPEIRAGLDALYAVGQRGAQSKRFILKADELVAMNLAMEIHDTQLDNATVSDLEKALDIVAEEQRAKRTRNIVKKETA